MSNERNNANTSAETKTNNSGQNLTTRNTSQMITNDSEKIRLVGDPFWNTPVDFKITTFDEFMGWEMKFFEDHLHWWAEDMGNRIYGNQLQIKKIPS
jgi:hypothetical protein